jgi:CrcB protein
MQITPFLLVCTGGALGAVARALCTEALKTRTPNGFPFPTLVVNAIACFLIGVIAASHPDSIVTAFVCTGFFGGFSTMSTMNYEAVTFFVHHRYARCALYLTASYGSCLIATAGGMMIACISATSI